MEFEDAWLEVRACSGGSDAVAADGNIFEVPALSEVLEAAANASKHPAMWEYSRRLKPTEVEAIRNALKLVKTVEDGRSVSQSADLTYKGSCYTLTLFAVKRSQ